MSISFDADYRKLQRAGREYLQGSAAAGQEKTAGTGSASVSRTGKNFDEIMIRAHRKSEEEDFVKSAVSKLSVEARKSASDESLSELRGRISAGKYAVNADQVAGRMLLDE